MPDVQEQIDAIEAEMVSTNNFNEVEHVTFSLQLLCMSCKLHNLMIDIYPQWLAIVMHYYHLVQSLSYLQLTLALNDNIYFRYSSY